VAGHCMAEGSARGLDGSGAVGAVGQAGAGAVVTHV